MPRLSIVALSLILLMLFVPSIAGLQGNVTKVIDGNTFEVQNLGVVRLADIQSDESAKPFAEKMLLNKTIGLTCEDNLLCVVYLPDGRDFNWMLVESAHAWYRTSPRNETWHSALEGGCDCSTRQLISSGNCAYIGNNEKHKFHVPGCSWVHLITDDHIVCFSSAGNAIAAGYDACQKCNPA